MVQRYKTQEVADLYEELKPYCNSERPFLDPDYACPHPVTDFTLVVAKWLLAEKYDAVFELCLILIGSGTPQQYLIRKALRSKVNPVFEFDLGTCAEIEAIYILSHISRFNGNTGAASISSSLVASRLASIPWKPPRECLEELKKIAAVNVWEEEGKNKRLRRMEVAEKAIQELLSDRPKAAAIIGEWMILIPPMVRIVIEDYFNSGWHHGSLRPELYYHSRYYGCSPQINLQYIQWIGCFREPEFTEKLPARITKTHIMQELCFLQTPPSKKATRQEMIEILKDYPASISKLMKSHAPEIVLPKVDWKEGLEDWSSRCQRISCVASAILAEMGQSMLHS